MSEEKTMQELFEDYQKTDDTSAKNDNDNDSDTQESLFELNLPEDVSKVKFGDEEFDIDQFKNFVNLGKETHEYMEKNKPVFRDIEDIEKEEKQIKENYEKDGTSLYNEFLLKAYNHGYSMGVKPQEIEEYKQMASHWLLQGYKSGDYTNFRKFINQNDAVELDNKINQVTSKYDGLLSNLEKEKEKTKYKGNIDKVSELVKKYDSDIATKEVLSTILPELSALGVNDTRIQQIAEAIKKLVPTKEQEDNNLKKSNDGAKKALMQTSIGKTTKTIKETKKVSLDNIDSLSVEEQRENLNTLFKEFTSKKK